MKKSIPVIILLLLILFSFHCNTQPKEAREKESYETTKKALLTKEQKDPRLFLTVKSNSKKNIIGQTVVTGTISNKASIATFKDIELKLSFYSATKALLETDKETIFLIVDPGESRHFKTKYFAPKGTDSVALQVLSAKVVPINGQ